MEFPAFAKPGLKGLTRRVKDSRAKDMSNWPKFHRTLRVVTHEATLLSYLCVELETRRRPDIISRVFNRFQTVRRANEIAALQTVAPGAGYRNGRFV